MRWCEQNGFLSVAIAEYNVRPRSTHYNCCCIKIHTTPFGIQVAHVVGICIFYYHSGRTVQNKQLPNSTG